jgi:hypothetical protein
VMQIRQIILWQEELHQVTVYFLETL